MGTTNTTIPPRECHVDATHDAAQDAAAFERIMAKPGGSILTHDEGALVSRVIARRKAEQATWSRAQWAAEWDRVDAEEERTPQHALWCELVRTFGLRVPTDDQLRDALVALRRYAPPEPDPEDDTVEDDDTTRPEPTLVDCIHYMLHRLSRQDPIAGRRIRLIEAAVAEITPASEKLRERLEEAKKTHKPSILLEAKGLIQSLSEAEYADFRAAVRQAKQDGLLDIDIRQVDKVRREGKAGVQKWNNVATDTGKPVIILNKQLFDTRQELIRAFQKANQPPVIYKRIRDLVRYVEAEGNPYLERMDWMGVRARATEAALFYFDDTYKPAYPPRAMCEDLVAAALPVGTFPEILGIQSLPIIRPDGSVATVPGYDSVTKLVYHAPPGFRLPELPERPTAADVEKAKNALLDLVVDFPFATHFDATNFFGFLVTLVIRHLVPVVPLALFGAPDSGTGKGLLVDLGAVIATGDVAAAVTAPTSRQEWPKLLFSLLGSGRSFISFDNVTDRFASDALEACLTKRFYQNRILGRSEERVVVNNATWSMTANNAQVGHDMARRCYPINLDAKVSMPFLRTGFKYKELVEHAKNERANLIWALLVLVRNGFEKKADFQGVQLGTFHHWRNLVGGILTAAGFTSFLGNQRSFFTDADHETAIWEQFLLSIRDVLGDGAFSAGQLAHHIHQRSITAIPTAVGEIYGTAISTTERTEPTPAFNTRLGHVLRSHIGTRYGQYEVHLEKASPDPHGKVARYHVVRETFDGPKGPLEATGDVPVE